MKKIILLGIFMKLSIIPDNQVIYFKYFLYILYSVSKLFMTENFKSKKLIFQKNKKNFIFYF